MTSSTGPAGRPLRTAVALLAALLAAGAGLGIRWTTRSPDSAMLLPDGPARWIRVAEPFSLFAKPADNARTVFRRAFVVSSVPVHAVLTVRAMKDAAVRLDGRDVLAPSLNPGGWRSARGVDLAPGLAPGAHELLIGVMNPKGPTLLLARCAPLGLFTGDGAWEAGRDGLVFAPAEDADAPRRAALSLQFPRVSDAVVSQLPFFSAVLLIAIGALFVSGLHPAAAPLGDPVFLRRAATAAWIALAANNILKIPLHVGYDVSSHLDYVRWIIDKRSIPLANDDVQTFQSPLFYMAAAALLALFRRLCAPETAVKLLRLIPLACGIAQVQLASRACALVFPENRRAQAYGTILGAYLPMNLLISQAIGNEPLAGALSAGAIVLFLSAARGGFRAETRFWAGLGTVLGLALLAKVSAFLLVAPLVLFLCVGAARAGIDGRRASAALGAAACAAFLVCGWYYVRNWIALGAPFVGGWDSARGIVWWQDPGYRTPRQFLTFGESLIFPVFSGARGFWDGYYSTLWLDGQLSGRGLFEFRPPWNYGAMISGAWLALLPTAGIVIGLGRAARRPFEALDDGRLFCAAVLVVYAGALLAMNILVPTYAQAKATYTLGAMPCYAVIGAAGLDAVSGRRAARCLVAAGLALWAAAAYSAYFVVG